MSVTTYERQTPTVGAIRRFVHNVLIEAAYGLARASCRLLPSDHPARVFREEVLAATDDAHRYALGHEWQDAHALARLGIVLLVLAVLTLAAWLVAMEIAGVVGVVVHHHGVFHDRER